MTETGTISNPYLDLRRRNIQRNEAKLRALGLLKPKPILITRSKPDLKKKIRPPSVRRSSRRTRRPDSYDELLFGSVGLSNRKSSAEDTAASAEYIEEVRPKVQDKKITRGLKVKTDSVSFPANSARSISLELNRLVHSKLGKSMQRTGKAAVMEEAAQQFSADPLHDSICNGISFNKYCGVQEWSGNRIFLWVNLGGPQSEYANDFADEGKRVSF